LKFDQYACQIKSEALPDDHPELAQLYTKISTCTRIASCLMSHLTESSLFVTYAVVI